MADSQKSKRGTRAERRAYWQSHIAVWEPIGGSKRAYCREHGLNPGSFYRWYGKLRGVARSRSTFIPLRLPVRASSDYAIELTLGNGGCLRIGADADPAWIAHVVRALEATC